MSKGVHARRRREFLDRQRDKAIAYLAEQERIKVTQPRKKITKQYGLQQKLVEYFETHPNKPVFLPELMKYTGRESQATRDSILYLRRSLEKKGYPNQLEVLSRGSMWRWNVAVDAPSTPTPPERIEQEAASQQSYMRAVGTSSQLESTARNSISGKRKIPRFIDYEFLAEAKDGRYLVKDDDGDIAYISIEYI